MPKGFLSVVIGLAMFASVAFHVSSAYACMGSNVLLQDNFQTLAANWGPPSDQQSVNNGVFVMKPSLTKEFHALNNGNLFTDMDACVNVTAIQSQANDNYSGMIFWAADLSNYYEILLSIKGKYSVYRDVGGRWITIVDWTPSQAIRTGLSQTNMLRVVTKGTAATFYVNGTELSTITGQPPQGGGEIGLVGSSGDKTLSVFQFSKLKVTN